MPCFLQDDFRVPSNQQNPYPNNPHPCDYDYPANPVVNMSHHFQPNPADFSDESFSPASTTTTTGNDLTRVEHVVQSATSMRDTTTTDSEVVQQGCEHDNCDNDVTVVASLADFTDEQLDEERELPKTFTKARPFSEQVKIFFNKTSPS